MDNLVCPDCGHDSFEAVLTTQTKYTYEVDESAGLCEVDESVYDGGDLDEIDQVTCNGCGEKLYPEIDPDPDPDGSSNGYLVTREAYDHAQDYEPDFEGIMEARMASREPAGDTW